MQRFCHFYPNCRKTTSCSFVHPETCEERIAWRNWKNANPTEGQPQFLGDNDERKMTKTFKQSCLSTTNKIEEKKVEFSAEIEKQKVAILSELSVDILILMDCTGSM